MKLPSLALIALTFDFGPVEELEAKRGRIERKIISMAALKATYEEILGDASRPMWQRQEAAAVLVELQNKLNKLYADENEIQFTLDEFEREFGEQMSHISVGDA